MDECLEIVYQAGFLYKHKEIYGNEELEVLEMSEVEKEKLLEITNFTPNDTESLRKPWIRKANRQLYSRPLSILRQ